MESRRRAVLLGAGASREAGLKLTGQLAEYMVRSANEEMWSRRSGSTRALNFVYGMLVAHDSSDGGDPLAPLDVERLFSAVELLSQRSDLEVTPFVRSWHPAVATYDVPQFSRSNDQLKKEILDVTFGRPAEVVQEIVRAEIGGSTGDTYKRLMGELKLQLRKALRLDNPELDYLKPLFEMIGQGQIRSVATLNYDLVVESAADRLGVELDRGIESWIATGRIQWGSAPRLLKLHGSLDWSDDWISGQDRAGTLNRRTIAITNQPYDDPSEPSIVFGQRGKLRAAGPFLELLEAFRCDLFESDELLVVGYSFRDAHINEVIGRWMDGSASRRLLVIDPTIGKELNGFNDGNSFLGALSWLAPSRLSSTGVRQQSPDRVAVIDAGAGVGLVEAVGSWDSFF